MLTSAWSAWRTRSESLRSFENWLVCWILLPNAGYWLLLIIGGPPRPLPILITGALGIVTHRAPFAVKMAAFLIALATSALFFVSAMFNLSPFSVVHSLRFATELSPSASIEYLTCAVAVLVTLFVAVRLLRRPTVLYDLRKLALAGLLTWSAAWADASMSAGSVGSYKRSPSADTPFTSAVDQSGLFEIADGKRNVILVMVEAMGEPVDPELRNRLVDIWASPEVRARYDVQTGSTLFFGSTTTGEIRELCGRWGDYYELRERADPGCLPSRLAARGYRTQAWHSFKGSFFDRTRWYPNIGFTSFRFGDTMVEAGAEVCPGVFPGACDRDVPIQMAAELKRQEGPQFLYWLTVNSHLPVLANKRLQTSDCTAYDPRMAEDFPMTCRLFKLFEDLGQSLSREITAPDFPDADILIVGDHIPPFFDRQNRDLFEPDSVPWILLRARPHADAPVRVAAR